MSIQQCGPLSSFGSYQFGFSYFSVCLVATKTQDIVANKEKLSSTKFLFFLCFLHPDSLYIFRIALEN